MLLRLPNDLLDVVCEFAGELFAIGLPVCVKFNKSAWRVMNRKLAHLNSVRGMVPPLFSKLFSVFFTRSFHFRPPGFKNSYFNTTTLLKDKNFIHWLMLHNFTDPTRFPEWLPEDMTFTKAILSPVALRDSIPDVRALSTKSVFYNPISGKCEQKQNLLLYRSLLVTQGLIICPGGRHPNAHLTIFFRYPYSESIIGYKLLYIEIHGHHCEDGLIRHRYHLYC